MIRNYSFVAESEGERYVEVRPSEQLLISSTREFTARRILCTSLGRAQFAAEFVRRCPESRVDCFFLDLCLADLARLATNDASDRLTIHCAADLPSEEFDLVAFPLSAQGDGELTREMLQTGHQRLVQNGQLVATTDNAKDVWLHGEMKKLFAKVTRWATKKGVTYQATKTSPLRKVKNFDARFAFRDGERLVYVFSRPGVFSHRHLDLGARALIEAAEVQEDDRILELGCGSGAVSLAAAMRAPRGHVTAVDSNPRAVACTLRGAQLNGLANLTASLNADADPGTEASFDLVLANPPYYSRFRIAEIFLRGAERALRSGGLLQLVTKRPDDFDQRMPAGFHDITVQSSRNYWIIRAVRR
jgi:16S rRNA G1207 methylase RsmC